jgi:ribosomal protein L37AE/L43A
MPLDNIDFRMACDVANANEQCRVCRSAKVTIAFSTVTAVYWTCQSCEATWSEPRAATSTSAAFRISKIVESRRPATRP